MGGLEEAGRVVAVEGAGGRSNVMRKLSRECSKQFLAVMEERKTRGMRGRRRMKG